MTYKEKGFYKKRKKETYGMKKKQILSILLAMTMSMSGAVTVLAADAQDDFAAKTTEAFKTTDSEYWPETRWWMAEGSHTDETLKESIDELYNNGVGAVEFVTLNVASLTEDQELNDRYAWGSDEWIHDSSLIIDYCTQKGMGVSFTSGTHWGTANLVNITPDDESAAQELGYTTVSVKQGETFNGNLPKAELTEYASQIRLVKALAVKVADDSIAEQKLVADSAIDITDQVNGSLEKVTAADNEWSLDFSAGDGDYTIFCFWQYGTSEFSQPAIGEGRSYTINYFSDAGSDAWLDYWDTNVVPDSLKELIQENGDVSLYMDSLELQTAGTNTTGYFWSEEFLDEFEKRAGYDLTPYIPIVITSSTQSFVAGTMQYRYTYEGQEELCSKIRKDILQVSTELYTEKCLKKLKDWANSFGMTVRAEVSYGQKLEISEPATEVDYIETESFEFGNEIDSYRLLSGAAHLLNKTLSSETGATFSGNYKYTNSTWRNVFYTQFVSGIQRTVMHGYASKYGPEGTVKWPGFEGMSNSISLRYSDRQPASEDFFDVDEDGTEYGLSAHLAKIQDAMRKGSVLMDLAILRSDYNVENISGMSKSFATNSLHKGEGIYWQDMTLQQSGYTYDYFSPLLLNEEGVTWKDGLLYGVDGNAAYQAVVVYQDDFPYEAADTLLSMAEAGVPIIFVDTQTVEHVRPSSQGAFMAPSLPEGAFDDEEDSEYKESEGWRTNESAAIYSTFNDATDEELKEVIDKIRSYDNVVSVTDISDTYDVLQSLGVQPRAAYAEQNEQLLTALRQDGDTKYLLVYNYQFSDVNEESVYYEDHEKENCKNEISVEGIAKPYVVDTWSGQTKEAAKYRYEDGRTILDIDLAPGDVILFALDGSIEESEAVDTDNSETVKDTQALGNWDLTVESWTPGEEQWRYEYVYENEDGEKIHSAEELDEEGYTYLYTTGEYDYATNKEEINVGTLEELVPWKDMEAVGDQVSGVGTYTTSFTLDELSENEKVYFNAESFGGGTARVLVNGKNVYVNMNNGKADITDAVVSGENTIEVRVTTTLTNVLNSTEWFGENPADTVSYGMIGDTNIVICEA